MNANESVSVTFFEALKSPRRLANLASVNQFFKAYLPDHLTDELAVIEELNDWHLYAGDGHYHKAAIFDPLTKAEGPTKRRANRPPGISSGSICEPTTSAT